jgi:hypothetical protein
MRRLTESDKRKRVMEAWMIVTKLWHGRLKTNKTIESANDRADRNANLVHSVGACRVAVWAAVGASLVISLNNLAAEVLSAWVRVSGHSWLSRFLAAAWESFRFSRNWPLAPVALMGVGIILYVCETSYSQVLDQASDFVLRVLEEALKSEKARTRTAEVGVPLRSS